MVTMVYPSPEGMDSALARAIARMRAAGELFRGPRSFAFWHIAAAYAMLPASPLITQTPRRRIYQLPNGRWSVVQTARPTRYRRCGPRPDGYWRCAPGLCDRPSACLLPDPDPCERGCSDPWAHAEGAHDV